MICEKSLTGLQLIKLTLPRELHCSYYNAHTDWSFRRAAESVIAICTALPKHVLDDAESKDAYAAINHLVKMLLLRAAASRAATPVASDKASSVSLLRPPARRGRVSSSSLMAASSSPVPGSFVTTPAISPSLSKASSRSSTPDPDHSNIRSASELQARFGTGSIPTPSKASSVAPTPATPASPASSDTASDEPEIWEYRGNLLTRSALSLVMRQEALARADSSGQYAGEVSWDDVRNAWIPKWAEKAKVDDLADGELPSTNPADFKVKRKDAWGNTIGWRDGVM